MDKACDTYGGEKEHVQSFGLETRKKDTTWNTWT
jgi:hypothetical protein